MKNTKLPFIFIFDIDNCIIGNIEWPLKESIILDNINYIIKKKKKVDFSNYLKKVLLRPYFKEFLKFIKKNFKNVEIYVYTNSNNYWTNNGLVSNIEKALGYKFNKPYYSSEYSNENMQKSLSNVYFNILKNLNKKYPLLKNNNYINYVFNNNLIFIDNLPNNVFDYPNKQLLCKSYNWCISYNIQKKIIHRYKINKNIFKNSLIIDKMNKNNIPYLNNNKLKAYYKYAILYQYNTYKNVDKDYYFKNLIYFIRKNKIKNFNSNNIKILNKLLN